MKQVVFKFNETNDKPLSIVNISDTEKIVFYGTVTNAFKWYWCDSFKSVLQASGFCIEMGWFKKELEIPKTSIHFAMIMMHLYDKPCLLM